MLVLVFGVLAAPDARASVPMCSGDGRSVIAPPTLMPGRGLVLEAPRPCPQPEPALVRGVPHDPGGQPAPPSDGPMRALPIAAPSLPLPHATRGRHDHAARSTGLELISAIERPPRR